MILYFRSFSVFLIAFRVETYEFQSSDQQGC